MPVAVGGTVGRIGNPPCAPLVAFESDSQENAVLADEVRQLSQKLSKPGVLPEQPMSLVGWFVATRRRLIAAKGIFKQRKSVIGRFVNPE